MSYEKKLAAAKAFLQGKTVSRPRSALWRDQPVRRLDAIDKRPDAFQLFISTYFGRRLNNE